MILVGGVAVGVDEDDGDRLDVLRDQSLAGGDDTRFRQRLDHRTIGRHSLGDFEPMPPRHQRRRLVPGEVEHVGHADAPDFEHVAKAARRDQTGARALSLQDGVGADGGAVQHFGDGGRVDRKLGQKLRDAFDHRDAGIGRRRGNLALMDQAGIGQQRDVGKRTAYVDRNSNTTVLVHRRPPILTNQLVNTRLQKLSSRSAGARRSCSPDDLAKPFEAGGGGSSPAKLVQSAHGRKPDERSKYRHIDISAGQRQQAGDQQRLLTGKRYGGGLRNRHRKTR